MPDVQTGFTILGTVPVNQPAGSQVCFLLPDDCVLPSGWTRHDTMRGWIRRTVLTSDVGITFTVVRSQHLTDQVSLITRNNLPLCPICETRLTSYKSEMHESVRYATDRDAQEIAMYGIDPGPARSSLFIVSDRWTYEPCGHSKIIYRSHD